MKNKESSFEYQYKFKKELETYEDYVNREIGNIASFTEALSELLKLSEMANTLASEIDSMDPGKNITVDELKSYAITLMNCFSGERYLNMLLVKFFVKLRSRNDVMEVVRNWNAMYPDCPFKLNGIDKIEDRK